jgi:serine/threonine protein kinase
LFKQTGFVLAVKVILVGKNHDAITKEVDLLKRVNHKNAVRYYGKLTAMDVARVN